MVSEINPFSQSGRISTLNNNKAGQASGQETAAGSTGDNKTTQGAQASSVNITEAGLKLQSLHDELKAMPDVDAEKVARIKAAIVDGSYQVNPQAVAEKMIEIDSPVKD